MRHENELLVVYVSLYQGNLMLNVLCRGYTGQKLQSNLECEIFQILREEAEESYRNEIIMTMKNNTIEDMSNNVEVLREWVASWKPHEA